MAENRWRQVGLNAGVVALLVLGVVAGLVALSDRPEQASAAAVSSADQPSPDSCAYPADSAGGEAGPPPLDSERERLSVRLASTRARIAGLRARDRRTPAQQRRLAVATERRRELRAQVARWDAVEATVEDGTATSFQFGHAMTPGPRSIAIVFSPALPGRQEYGAVRVASFAPDPDGPELGPNQILSWARVHEDRLGATVSFCLLPEARADAAGGRYAGALELPYGPTTALDVPATFSMAYPHIDRAVLVGLLACLATSWYVYFLRKPSLGSLVLYGREIEKPTKEQEEKQSRVLRSWFGFWGGYWRFFTGESGVITAVAGLLAAFTAFNKAYLSSEDWAGSFGDWAVLAGAVATAFLAGGTAGKLAQNTYDGKATPAPQPVGGAAAEAVNPLD